MSEDRLKLWDQMAEVRHKAVSANEKALHWAVNRAAIYSLMADERVAQQYSQQRFEDRPFYGLAFKIDERDRSDEPAFKLVTMESLDRK